MLLFFASLSIFFLMMVVKYQVKAVIVYGFLLYAWIFMTLYKRQKNAPVVRGAFAAWSAVGIGFLYTAFDLIYIELIS